RGVHRRARAGEERGRGSQGRHGAHRGVPPVSGGAPERVPPAPGEPELQGQTVVLIGGSAGIGLATARRARAEGAEVVLAGRNPERLEEAAKEVGARSTAAFDATDREAVEGFFAELPDPIDHVLITAGGPSYGPMLEMDADQI